MSLTVVITGAAGPLGRRVAALSAADPDVTRVIAIDRDLRPGDLASTVEVHALSATDPEIKRFLAEADALIHLGVATVPGPDGLPTSGEPAIDLAVTRSLLDDAAAVGLRHLVVLSSAMVYGAWANNPVPLTEDAPLRPDPALSYATARAESERQSFEWRNAQVGSAVAVLRPTVSVAAESADWLAPSPWSAASLRSLGTDRPSQFLHLDDLASAIDHARRLRLDGPFNVAPDGWLPADQLRDLAGPVGRVHLPAGFSGRLTSLRSMMGISGPPEGWGYTQHSWVVANDKLRATGWQPHHRNDEVYVEADPGGPLAAMSPRRRQELSLLAAAGFVATAIGAVVWSIRRSRRRS
jgi:nucleoside-diphosphate-sugar epimerase